MIYLVKISKDRKPEVIAQRDIKIQSSFRCFCIWNCRCTCISAYATTGSSAMCKIMPDHLAKDAGLQFIDTSQKSFNWHSIIFILSMVFTLVMLLGKKLFAYYFHYS